MTHADALSKNSISLCLTIDECEAGLTARLKKAQREEKDLKKKVDEAEKGQLDGYTM